ncbi:MAG TPA: DUF6702 family protein [Gemmatimonadales bacterium]|nr:DUF6702 family protein [Gemmatimonadales bacterium]
MTLALLLLALAGFRHPMHTSVAYVRYDATARVARIAIRVYADDLTRALPDAAAPGDSALARYVRARFSMTGSDGSPMPLAWAGAERAAEAVVLRFEARQESGVRGMRIGSTILHERFPDQVNVVRMADGSRTTTLLFLRGDPPKTVP